MNDSVPAQTAQKQKKPLITPYTSFLLFNMIFFMLDTTASYFQIYLSDIGLTKTMIGTITGTASLVALVFQPVFGAVADGSKSKNRILQLMLLITAILYPAIMLNQSMVYILIVYTLFVVFRRFQPSLNTTMSVEYSEQSGKPYGPIRMMGAVGYALMMMFISQLSEQDNGIPKTFYMFTLIAIVNIGIIFFMPKMEGHNRKTSTTKKVSPATLIKCKPIMILILFQILLSIASGFGNSYFSLYFTGDMGGSNALYGTMLSISAFIEIPFLFIADKIIKKLGARKVLFILGIITATRWFICFFATSTTTLFIVRCFNFINILEGVTYSLTLSRLVAPRFKTSVQTLSATIQNVASILLSSYLGGFLADLVGIRPLFMVAGILVAGITVVFCGFLIKFNDDTPVFEG